MKTLLNWHDMLANITFVLDKESFTSYGSFLKPLIFIKQMSRNLIFLCVNDSKNK